MMHGATGPLAVKVIRQLLNSGIKVVAGSDDVAAVKTVFDFAKKYELISKAAGANLSIAELDGSPASLKAVPRGAKLVIIEQDQLAKGVSVDMEAVEQALELAVAISASQVILVSCASAPAAPAAAPAPAFKLFNFGGAPAAKAPKAATQATSELSASEQMVVDSGVPYAILRANGTDSLLDSETEAQFITLAPLGSLPPTAASSGEQVATVVNQLLTTVGSDFVVEMTDSDETPEQDRREVLAEIISAAQEAAAAAPPRVTRASAAAADAPFRTGTISIGRAAKASRDSQDSIDDEGEGGQKSNGRPAAAAAKPSANPFAKLLPFGKVAALSSMDVDGEEDEDEESEPEPVKAKPGLFGFGGTTRIQKSAPVAASKPTAAQSKRAKASEAFASMDGDDSDDEAVVDKSPFGGFLKAIGTVSMRAGDTNKEAGNASPKGIAAKKTGTAVLKRQEAPAKASGGGGLFGFGAKPVQVEAEEDSDEEEEEVVEKKKGGGESACHQPGVLGGFFGFGAKAKAAEVEEEEDEEDDEPVVAKKAGGGFFGFGAKPLQVEAEEDSDEEEEEVKPKSGFFGFGAKAKQVEPEEEEEEEEAPKKSGGFFGFGKAKQVEEEEEEEEAEEEKPKSGGFFGFGAKAKDVEVEAPAKGKRVATQMIKRAPPPPKAAARPPPRSSRQSVDEDDDDDDDEEDEKPAFSLFGFGGTRKVSASDAGTSTSKRAAPPRGGTTRVAGNPAAERDAERRADAAREVAIKAAQAREREEIAREREADLKQDRIDKAIAKKKQVASQDRQNARIEAKQAEKKAAQKKR
ncbi:MAG: hypothetical protein WDW36_000920 [Sanguina aurantia]